jgi:hypothetical protein
MSTYPVPEEIIFAQWDFLYNTFGNEINFGGSPPVPGGGSNTNGRLQSVASWGKTTWPDFLSLPYVGVQLEKVDELYYASQRKHEFKSFFTVVGVVEVKATADGILKVDDAMEQLRLLLMDNTNPDGIKRGILPILRDSTFFGLGSQSNGQKNADTQLVTGYTLKWDQAPAGKSTTYVAWAEIAFEATVRLHVGLH